MQIRTKHRARSIPWPRLTVTDVVTGRDRVDPCGDRPEEAHPDHRLHEPLRDLDPRRVAGVGHHDRDVVEQGVAQHPLAHRAPADALGGRLRAGSGRGRGDPDQLGRRDRLDRRAPPPAAAATATRRRAAPGRPASRRRPLQPGQQLGRGDRDVAPARAAPGDRAGPTSTSPRQPCAQSSAPAGARPAAAGPARPGRAGPAGRGTPPRRARPAAVDHASSVHRVRNAVSSSVSRRGTAGRPGRTARSTERARLASTVAVEELVGDGEPAGPDLLDPHRRCVGRVDRSRPGAGSRPRAGR